MLPLGFGLFFKVILCVLSILLMFFVDFVGVYLDNMYLIMLYKLKFVCNYFKKKGKKITSADW